MLAVFTHAERLADDSFVSVRATPWQEQLLVARTDEAELRAPADGLNALWDDACDHENVFQLPGDTPEGQRDHYYCADDVGGERPCALDDDLGSVSCEPPECLVATACDSDADCDAYFECRSETRRDCPEGLDSSCMEGESDGECAARTQALVDAECETREESWCRPVWELPCQDDARCGTGFGCVGGRCEPEADMCSGDADCPGPWLCRSYDGGFCEADTDELECVDGQLRVVACVPPATGVVSTGVSTDSASAD